MRLQQIASEDWGRRDETRIDLRADGAGEQPMTDLMADAAEALWGVVANASGGDWRQQTREWDVAAGRARDMYYAALSERRKPTPPALEPTTEVRQWLEEGAPPAPVYVLTRGDTPIRWYASQARAAQDQGLLVQEASSEPNYYRVHTVLRVE